MSQIAVWPVDVVAEEEIGTAVDIEVAGLRDRPRRVIEHDRVGERRGAVHEPRRDAAGAALRPREIGLAVAVEVAGRGDGPQRIEHDVRRSTAARCRS